MAVAMSPCLSDILLKFKAVIKFESIMGITCYIKDILFVKQNENENV